MFEQEPPALGNQYNDDPVLRGYLQRALPRDVHDHVRPALRAMGARAGGDLYALQQANRTHEPELTRWDAWGRRVDRISITAVWREAERVAAQEGLVALPYERPHGPFSRVVQFALAYLFIPSTDMYGCPLAMTDGAARALIESGDRALVDRAVPHLTSRDPASFWTSGQWMTELPGGSDVSRTETTARRDDDGTWRLYGRKWFTSAITAQMALALARPECGAGDGKEGSRGLALFFVPIRDRDDVLRDGIRVDRLKDKLGTRKLPTAELTLEGAEAVPVGPLRDGVRQVAPMLNVTRTWNAVTACAYMRRGLALARDYARKRHAFGRPLAELPLHADTLDDIAAVAEGAFHLTFRTAALLGRQEAGAADEAERRLLRVLTPIAKLTTARQCVAVCSEVLEAFGGAGYIEDTGLPVLLRDAQVLPIWEGTTNVLALDTLRAMDREHGLGPLRDEVGRCAEAVHTPELTDAVAVARAAAAHAVAWLQEATGAGRPAVEAGARRFALTLGRALELALLCRHAQWALDHGDDRPAASASRLAAGRIDTVRPLPTSEPERH